MRVLHRGCCGVDVYKGFLTALGQQGAKGGPWRGADGDEEGGAVAYGAKGRGEGGEELLLEDVGEQGELLGQGELHGVGGGKQGRISTVFGYVVPSITRFYSIR
jgi:hypothetical protein